MSGLAGTMNARGMPNRESTEVTKTSSHAGHLAKAEGTDTGNKLHSDCSVYLIPLVLPLLSLALRYVKLFVSCRRDFWLAIPFSALGMHLMGR